MEYYCWLIYFDCYILYQVTAEFTAFIVSITTIQEFLWAIDVFITTRHAHNKINLVRLQWFYQYAAFRYR
jgi:hypothetical protein